MPNCINCSTYFPSRITIDGKVRGIHNRKYCLTCLPFKSHNFRSEQQLKTQQRTCPRCKQSLPIEEFFVSKTKRYGGSYCKKCNRERGAERTYKIKQQCLDYLGGKCIKCGYDKCPSALDFHHKDPNKKEFTIGDSKHTSFEDLKPELDKCFIICSNCHRELHYKGPVKYDLLGRELEFPSDMLNQ